MLGDGDLNYRTTVNVLGGVPKLQLNKYCPAAVSGPCTRLEK